MSDLREEVLEAAKSGDAVLLNEILMKLDCTKRISLLAAFERRNTPLILAVQNGNLDCVKVLLKYGADIEGRGYLIYLGEEDQRRRVGYRSCTPLFVAAAYGNVEILKFLVENGANVNTNNNHDSISPLMVAIKHQFTDAVSFLIDQGADVNSEDNSGKTALHCAIEQNFDALSCLITHGADINAVTNEKCTPLMIACKHHNDSAVNFLLENGADVALRDNNGETALHYVWNRSGSSAKILSSLIKYGVDINTRRNNPINETHLMNASHCSAVTTVTLLIEHGASVDLQDQCGNTALHYAVTEKSEETVCALVNAGASHLCNGRELTPLLLACNDCYVTMVECLIKQPGMTKEEKINALELLGASLLIEECVCKDEFESDIEEGLMYIKRGMIERFSDPSDPLLKRQMEPVEAYQNRKESQTFEELVQIESDRDGIIMDSLLIRERILGRYHVELIQPIRDAANYFSCADDFSSCVRLYRHAMKTAQGCDQLAVLDLCDIISELCNWLETAKRKGSIEEDFFEVLDQTILDLDHEMQRRKAYRQDWIGPLFYALQELFFMICKGECADRVKLSSLGLLLKTMCNLDPRDSSGNTLLHKFALDHGGVSSRSYTGAVKLLLSAGLNVNATNGNGDTPLHIVATLKPGEDNIHLLTDMLQVLFDGGAHHDFVNKNGKTPIDLAETNEAVMIISDQSKLELQCISARAVRKFGIPYLGIVPKTLEKYISMH